MGGETGQMWRCERKYEKLEESRESSARGSYEKLWEAK